MIKNAVKSLLYPGVNLHARCRFQEIPKQFGAEVSQGAKVLDAGCGNGMLSLQAHRRGADVLGISIKQNEVDGCRQMFNRGRSIPEERLRFENLNLYDMEAAEYQFDGIICTEVLEHIKDDVGICRKFFELLRPGGCVHITSPNAEHPYNVEFPLDLEEKGGHVRPGYTEQTYRELLEPLGFEIDRTVGLGGKVRQGFNWRIKAAQESLGAWVGVPMFFAAAPFLWLDSDSPKVPFSLYVCARKPE